MSFNFDNKRALVTGAGRGIGREVVKQLVEANAKVVALSKTQQNLDSLKIEYPSIEIICVDISNWDETKRAIESIGDIDLLVNNAAFVKMTELGNIDEQIIDYHFDVNVKAVINITQILALRMKNRGKGGSIVNVSSIAGIIGFKDHLVYGATKAALDLMTKIMALELGPFNIRVNSVNPTVTWTEMASVGWGDPIKREKMLEKHPLNRFAKPEDVANTIVYLLSDKSNMISGALVPIDAGLLSSK